MKKIFTFFVLCSALQGSFAQLANTFFANSGAIVSVMRGALVVLNGDSLTNLSNTISNSGTVIIASDLSLQIPGNLNNSGIINNQGAITVQGTLTNNNGATITGTGDSLLVHDSWINNGTYTGNNSLVDLYGQNQFIAGSSITTFDNLSLGGGNFGPGTNVKRQEIDAITSGTLALNSAELATDVNQMLVTNTSPSAITFNQDAGFVSSVNPGNLAWATGSTSNYLFPVGAPSYVTNSSAPFIRPVQFTPVAANADVYAAALVYGNASSGGYDVNLLDDSLCAVNPGFYHLLAQTTGTDAAALTMFFDPGVDGTWSDEAHWGTPNANFWNYLGQSTVGTGPGYNTVTVNGVNNFVPAPFALARKKFTVNAGPAATIILGQSHTMDPVISTPIFDSISWTPDYNLSCTTCESPIATPTVSTLYTINVFEGACVASGAVQINVTPNKLLVPTAFSPNGDNSNDYFHILNTNLSRVDLQVFNRWGEKVYETNNMSDRGWDGTFQGVKQEMGVYVWQCQYELQGTNQLITDKGNVTLLR